MVLRSVSGIQKKIVAASQQWKCGVCNNLLSAYFEVDHIVALHLGGSNEESNLMALCRECHAVKTAKEAIDALHSEDQTIKPFVNKKRSFGIVDCRFCNQPILNRTSPCQYFHHEPFAIGQRSCKHERKLEINRKYQAK